MENRGLRKSGSAVESPQKYGGDRVRVCVNTRVWGSEGFSPFGGTETLNGGRRVRGREAVNVSFPVPEVLRIRAQRPG